MINLKKCFIKYILLLFAVDIVLIAFRAYGYLNMATFMLPQVLVSMIHLYSSRNKLYDILKIERKEVLNKYYFMGKYTSWEWNITKAAKETKDPLLIEIRNKVIVLNLFSFLFPINLILMLYLIPKLFK